MVLNTPGPVDLPMAKSRITFVQYGDFREAAINLRRGGVETYFGQRYSVELVEHLARSAEDLCVICVNSRPYQEVLEDGIRTFGLRLYDESTAAELVELIARQEPTHLIPRFPMTLLLRWAARQRIRVLPLLADSFPGRGLRVRIRYKKLAIAMNDPSVEWIGNHAVNASRDLERLGVRSSKIIPWDWPAVHRPDQFEERQLEVADRVVKLFYVGQVRENKGVGECLAALARATAEGFDFRFTFVGDGEIANYECVAAQLGVSDRATFLGSRPYEEVIELLRQHHIAVVPSRHEYPEGLPLSIYDAYCSRTPLIASDHPMFKDRVVHEKSALVFEAGNVESLTAALIRLATSRDLYQRLSHGSREAWERLQLPVRWGDLLMRWLSDRGEDRKWLAQYTLASRDYA